jgi:aspartate carbamoyltransferase catalytic subunit
MLMSHDSCREIMKTAEAMRVLVASQGGDESLLRGKVLACVFYESSTRTSCSFQVAMLRLGGKVIFVNEVRNLYN